MRIVFVSNFMNHHWLPFSNALLAEKDIDFIFTETETVPAERRSLGYSDFSDLPFVIKYDADAQKLIDEADAVIISEGAEYTETRLKNNKLTFRYAERLYKKGTVRRLRPKAYRFVNDRFLKYKNNDSFVLLCASAYTSYDVSLWGFPEQKCLKWGYFPDTGAGECPMKENEPVRIFWAGRMIPYKHPEYCRYLAEELQKRNINAKISMAGEGPLKKKLEKYPRIELKGALPFREVYEQMQNSDIFLFTSNRSEGWGAVLNECMQMGCVPVACSDAGSTPYLVRDGFNGFVYRDGNREQFADSVIRLIENESLRKEMSRNAFETINGLWNARIAAERLLMYIRSRDISFAEGPLSPAPVLKGGGFF